MRDLWPKSIVETARLISPLSILKEQAALLGKKTSNILEGLVMPISYEETLLGFVKGINTDEALYYAFIITAPTLSYRYRLFTITQSIDLYPLWIALPGDIASELGVQRDLKVNSESEFLEALAKIFASKKTGRIIHGLLAQAGAVMEK